MIAGNFAALTTLYTQVLIKSPYLPLSRVTIDYRLKNQPLMILCRMAHILRQTTRSVETLTQTPSSQCGMLFICSVFYFFLFSFDLSVRFSCFTTYLPVEVEQCSVQMWRSMSSGQGTQRIARVRNCFKVFYIKMGSLVRTIFVSTKLVVDFLWRNLIAKIACWVFKLISINLNQHELSVAKY